MSTPPETIRADVLIDGQLHTVTLVRVAADDDADRPWRIEQPSSPFDGWFVRASELRNARQSQDAQ